MINNLAELRKQKGFTQAELAQRIGKTAGYISFLENGRRNLTDDVRDRLCEVLECSPASLHISEAPGVPDEAAKSIASRMKRVREESDLSQREFARKIGCAHAMISRIEAGTLKPSERLLKKVAKAFRVDYSWLLIGVEYSEDQVDEDMETIDKYLRSNDLAREQVLRLIKDGRFEK